MEDLLQPQLEQSFRLAIPEGLRDLMCDISREVLRAKPTNLYQFIVDYLEALLLARDTLCNACKLCGEICQCTCQPELDEELRKLGLEGEDLEAAKNVVFKHFDKGDVHEASLMQQLLKKTDIDINLLEDVQVAVRAAYIRHERNIREKNKEETETLDGPGQSAAKKTIEIYERALTEEEEQKKAAAVKIQAAYRGHLIKASINESARKAKKPESEILQEEEILEDPPEPVETMAVPMIMIDPGTPRPSACPPPPTRAHYGRLSSTSLAGSFVHLPKHIPYSVHEITYIDFEEAEKERTNVLYTSQPDQDKKKIIFHDKHVLHEIDSGADDEEDGEEITEEIHTDFASLESDENIEDLVHNVTYDEAEEEQIPEDHTFIEDIVNDSIKAAHRGVEGSFDTAASDVEEEELQNKIPENQHVIREFEKKTGLHDKSIDDDDDDSGDDSMQNDEGEKKKRSNQNYAKADDEMMKTLKEKLMKLSSSEMVNDE